MNVTINFKDTSDEIDLKSDNTGGELGFVPDAGAPSADISASSNANPSASENSETVNEPSASESEDVDIGGPAEWLVEAMASLSGEDNDASDNTTTDDIDDGGSGPME